MCIAGYTMAIAIPTTLVPHEAHSGLQNAATLFDRSQVWTHHSEAVRRRYRPSEDAEALPRRSCRPGSDDPAPTRPRRSSRFQRETLTLDARSLHSRPVKDGPRPHAPILATGSQQPAHALILGSGSSGFWLIWGRSDQVQRRRREAHGAPSACT